ncbi:MAG: HAMP domain-containing sensor histidine kinase [Cyclobacteriaceae bacterium]
MIARLNIRQSFAKLNYNKQTIRFWSTAYMVFYLSFGYVDYLSAPVSYQEFWMIRLWTIPYFLLALLSTFIDVIKPYRLFINAVMVFAAPFSIILMIAVSDPAEWSMYIYFAGVVLAIFPVGFILMHVRFTVLICLGIALSYFFITGVGLNFYNGDNYFFIITFCFIVSALVAIILCTYLLESNQNKVLSQKQEVEELVKTKNRLIDIIAHDLKGPCSSIVGFSELFINNDQSFDVKDTRYFMENINNSAHNLQSLLENLLEWSRMQSGSYLLKPVEIPLDKLVARNIEMVRGSMNLKQITLRQSKIVSGLLVRADKYMIDTVFRNLLSNAVKFTPSGGEIDIRYWSAGSLACVSITDNGVGIDESRISDLFEVSNSKSTKGTDNEPGSGLGLVICHEFILRNNGDIWLKSIKGEGTTFTFTLPLQNIG